MGKTRSARSTLPATEESQNQAAHHQTLHQPQRTQVRDRMRRQQDAFQVGPPSPSMRAAMRVRRTSRHRVSQSLGALVSKPAVGLKDKRSHSCAVSLRLLEIAGSRCNSWFRRTDNATFCMWAPHGDVHPELLQDSWETGDNIQYRAPEHRFAIGLRLQPNRTAQGYVFPCLRILQRGRSVCSVRTGQHGAAWPWHLRICTTKGDTGASLVGGRTFNPRCPCAGRTWRAVPRPLT